MIADLVGDGVRRFVGDVLCRIRNIAGHVRGLVASDVMLFIARHGCLETTLVLFRGLASDGSLLVPGHIRFLTSFVGLRHLAGHLRGLVAGDIVDLTAGDIVDLTFSHGIDLFSIDSMIFRTLDSGIKSAVEVLRRLSCHGGFKLAAYGIRHITSSIVRNTSIFLHFTRSFDIAIFVIYGRRNTACFLLSGTLIVIFAGHCIFCTCCSLSQFVCVSIFISRSSYFTSLCDIFFIPKCSATFGLLYVILDIVRFHFRATFCHIPGCIVFRSSPVYCALFIDIQLTLFRDIGTHIGFFIRNRKFPTFTNNRTFRSVVRSVFRFRNFNSLSSHIFGI